MVRDGPSNSSLEPLKDGQYVCMYVYFCTCNMVFRYQLQWLWYTKETDWTEIQFISLWKFVCEPRDRRNLLIFSLLRCKVGCVFPMVIVWSVRAKWPWGRCTPLYWRRVWTQSGQLEAGLINRPTSHRWRPHRRRFSTVLNPNKWVSIDHETQKSLIVRTGTKRSQR